MRKADGSGSKMLFHEIVCKILFYKALRFMFVIVQAIRKGLSGAVLSNLTFDENEKIPWGRLDTLSLFRLQ